MSSVERMGDQVVVVRERDGMGWDVLGESLGTLGLFWFWCRLQTEQEKLKKNGVFV